MDTSADFSNQVRTIHAGFIHAIVAACAGGEAAQRIEPLLAEAQERGYGRLVACVRKVLAGRRDPGVLEGLDEEDHVIVQSVLDGLQNPATLPDPAARAEGAAAAPGLAHLIHAARSGDTGALQVLGNMGEAMQSVGGDMARLASRIRPLLQGERDPDRLAEGMTVRGRALVVSIVEELARLEPQ